MWPGAMWPDGMWPSAMWPGALARPARKYPGLPIAAVQNRGWMALHKRSARDFSSKKTRS